MRFFAGLGIGIMAVCVPGVIQAGPSLCTGASFLPDDQFEDFQGLGNDDSRTNANPAEVPSIAFREFSFSSDMDEDWLMVNLLATPLGGNLIVYRVETISLGLGIIPELSTNPPKGVGIRIQLFDDSGTIVTPVSGQADSFISSILDCGADISSTVDLEFEVPADGDYFFRISQCRNSVSGYAALNPCIPNDASYTFNFGFAFGVDPGKLVGVVTDVVTLQPLFNMNLATISSIGPGNLNNFAFTGKGFTSSSGPVADGSYVLSNSRNVPGTSFTARVTATGYDPVDVQFPLQETMVTMCDVALTPAGGGGEVPIFKNGFEGTGAKTFNSESKALPLTCTIL